MTEPSRSFSLSRIPLLLAAVLLAACVFDKPAEEAQLTLSHVPANVERIRVVAVDPVDTAKVLDIVYSAPWTPGKVLEFSLGKASGKSWLLRVEGYEKDFLVYLSFIPAGKGGMDTAMQVPVNRGLPAVYFTNVIRDGDSVRFTTAFRSVPEGLNWRLNLDVDSVDSNNYFRILTPGFSAAAAGIRPGALLVADLHLENRERYAVQDPDTMLADEALAPAGSRVRITEAYREGDSVHVKLALTNFLLPDVDEPKPGRGFPKVLEKSTFRVLSEFKIMDGDPTHLAAPAASLTKVKSLMVALYYANQLRIRPLAADSADSALFMRARVIHPTVNIDSTLVMGDTLRLFVTRTNFTGFHLHIYRDFLHWPDPPVYQTCYTSICDVEPSIWVGAKKVIIATQRDLTHELLVPIVSDTLLFP